MQHLLLGVILAALLSAPAVSAQAQSQGAKRSAGENVMKDTWLTTKTKSKLFADGRVKGRRIKVETHAGVVTLRGKVESEKEKIAAEQIAKSVDGVKAVNNVLQVVPNSQRKVVDAKDDDIENAITARFEKDAGLKAADIKVRSDNGLVTLIGTVPDMRAKTRAAELAKGVQGVRAVRNELRNKS